MDSIVLCIVVLDSRHAVYMWRVLVHVHMCVTHTTEQRWSSKGEKLRKLLDLTKQSLFLLLIYMDTMHSYDSWLS